MFGEKEMLGIEKKKVTAKGRLLLPDFCWADANDRLIILAFSDYLEIWEESMFLVNLENFRENNFMYSDEITAFIAKMGVQVDAVKRVNLTKKLVNEYFQDGKVFVEGKGSFIRVWSVENFLKHQSSLWQGNNSSLVLTRSRKKEEED